MNLSRKILENGGILTDVGQLHIIPIAYDVISLINFCQYSPAGRLDRVVTKNHEIKTIIA